MPRRPRESYPLWKFYPSHLTPPPWVEGVVDAFAGAQSEIDSRVHEGVSSNAALAYVRPGLTAIGFEVESGARKAQKILRPVLFGESGRPIVSYEVDGYHPEWRIALEVEAGRGAANNADYCDLVRASLMVDADYLVLAMMLRYGSGATRSYEVARNRIDAIYASPRLKLPLEGVLLVGY